GPRVRARDAPSRQPRRGEHPRDRDRRSEHPRRKRLRPLAAELIQVALGIDGRIEDTGELLDEILRPDQLQPTWPHDLDPQIVARFQARSAKRVDRQSDLVLTRDDTHPFTLSVNGK